MYSEILSGLSAIFLITVLLRYLQKRPERFPNGPFSWPIVGNLFQLGNEAHISLTNLKEKFGNVIGVDFGSRRSIVIHDIKLIKEAFNLPELSGRPKLRHFGEIGTGVNRGLAFSSGQQWMEQRSFILKTLGSFGLGRQSKMESLIQQEIQELIKTFEMDVGSSINTDKIFYVSVLNSLWTIVTSERLETNDPTVKKIINHLASYMRSPQTFGTLIFFPWLASLIPKLSGHNEVVGNVAAVLGFVQKFINSHKETYQEDVKRDLIDCYLHEIKKTTDPNSSFYKSTGESNMLHGLHDLFIGGTETTSTSLAWTFFLLAHFPEKQEKLFQTINDVVGKERLPSFTDRKSLPFVEAVVMEVLRFTSILALGLMREATEDFEFHGYVIPKGTLVHANQFYFHHDANIWGDANNFRPERFLTEDGSVNTRHEVFIPFGTGKRICPGENLARDQLFLFTASLVQRFKFAFDLNNPIPPLKNKLGTGFLMPVEHELILTLRV